MKFKYLLTTLTLASLSIISGYGSSLPSHCENDTVEIMKILADFSDDNQMPLNERIAKIAVRFVGRGVDDYYATDSLASLRMNVDTFTPETYVNTVLALADASRLSGANWRNFENRYGQLALRKGEDNGFPSIMWYSSDWIVDNTYRGNLRELTGDFDGANFKTKSLDIISRNSDKVAALSDADTAERLKMVEMGYRSHKLPYLPKSAIDRKDVAAELQNGDILVLVSKTDGMDTYRIGFVVYENDEPHFAYFDPQSGEVTVRKESLKRYFNLVTKYFSGFRWLRMREN